MSRTIIKQDIKKYVFVFISMIKFILLYVNVEK